VKVWFKVRKRINLKGKNYEKIILTLCLLSSSVFATLPSIQCNPAEKYDLDEWTIEVKGTKAAFFDNDTWSDATYAMDLEVMPVITQYRSFYNRNSNVSASK